VTYKVRLHAVTYYQGQPARTGLSVEVNDDR